MFELRDYQQETIDGIYSSMRKGNKTIVVQQPPTDRENSNYGGYC